MHLADAWSAFEILSRERLGKLRAASGAAAVPGAALRGSLCGIGEPHSRNQGHRLRCCLCPRSPLGLMEFAFASQPAFTDIPTPRFRSLTVVSVPSPPSEHSCAGVVTCLGFDACNPTLTAQEGGGKFAGEK